MAYFLVTVSVHDGEYEYWRYVLVKAKNTELAQELAMKSDKEWTRNDHREVTCEGIRAIPTEDYNVLIRYI